MATLRYPEETPPDFMTITAHEYSSRTSNPGNNRAGPSAGSIVLPIPNLPNVTSQQKYGAISGALNNLLATGLAEAYVAIDSAVNSPEGADGLNVQSIAERVRSRAQDAGGPVLRELAANAAGALVGINGAQFQTLAAGEISHPQLELLYAGPTLRSYPFSWTLVPKNATEANSIFEIIKFLKQSHLPSGNGAGAGMLKVPRIFRISTVIQGGGEKHYQKYFDCVLEGISVKQDSIGTHMTLPDGEPLATNLNLVFKEIYTLTRQDMENNI